MMYSHDLAQRGEDPTGMKLPRRAEATLAWVEPEYDLAEGNLV